MDSAEVKDKTNQEMKTYTTPQFTEVKCDYKECHRLANFYYEKILLERVDIRNFKVCAPHASYLSQHGHRDYNEIPYIDIAMYGVKCLRCSNIWTPRSFQKKYETDGKYMRLPGECPACGSKIYTENSLGSVKE